MEIDKTQIYSLIEAALSANYSGVKRIGGQIVNKLVEQGDIEEAKSLQNLLRKRGVLLQTSGYAETLPRDSSSRLPLLEEGHWPSSPIILGDDEGKFISHFIEDAEHINILSRQGISSRLGLLLYGPPGTGKTLLAGHIAALLKRPIYIARLDSLISSRLGETAKNIREIFEFIPNKKAVLFLDEIDAIAKIRDDRHELGELKRVVNTVIQGLDSLTDDIVTIAATNHHHLLDPAIWRRFPYKMELSLPNEEVRRDLWRHYLFQDNDNDIGKAKLLSRILDKLNGSDIENIALAARRRAILNKTSPDILSILLSYQYPDKINFYSFTKPKLGAEERKSLSKLLYHKGKIKQSEIAKLLGVSRQMIYRYIKEELK